MKESLYNADQELKRAEHLLYVSLKYTRTGDVIKSLVMRLIATFEFTIKAMLIKQEQDGTIDSIPEQPFVQVTLIKKLYHNDQKVCDFMDFYLLLRKISRESGNSSGEFRRNLTFSVPIDGKNIEITIDIAGDYYHKTVEFFRYICQLHLAE